jgi:hypothetical protein
MLLTIPTIAAPLRGPNAASVSTIPYQGRLADASGDPVTDKVTGFSHKKSTHYD